MPVVGKLGGMPVSLSQSPESSSTPSCGLALPICVGTFYQKYDGNPVCDEAEVQFASSNLMFERSVNPRNQKRWSVTEGLWVVFGRSGNKEWAALLVCAGLQKLVERFSRKWVEGHKFMRRLQFVKANLKEWNKVSFGELNERKKNILNDLANFDAIEQVGGLTSELLVQRTLKKRELEELILREEIHWRQKGRVKWVKEGDCNSKFFHKVANGRRNRKFIKVLENESGLVLNNSERIIEEILLYFEKFNASPTGESWSVEGLDWSLYRKRVRLGWIPLSLKKGFLKPFFSWIGIRRQGLMALPLQYFKIVGM
ncbi:hypothetical protein CK203_107561 [Vitis vinifera]|uniref:Uncharacterized protein n=1 Tax=Vitis vinifera TaxID=29760 RepID=A0A438DC33_VITVI|nr:hypothetical protein CK203_107561 [Vitis vinifera]